MTSPPTEVVATAAIEAYVAQQTAAALTLEQRVLTALAALWGQISDHRDPDQLSRFAQRAATVIRAAERSAAAVTEAYLRRVARVMKVPTPPTTIVRLPESLRFGVPLEDVVLRPAATVRYLRSLDTPRDAAGAAGAARLEAIGATHLQLAQREAARQVNNVIDTVTGYRRVIRPELSESGSCGLCIAASDRIYRKGDLLPIHDKCKCITLPVTRFADPGLRINDEDLRRLYAAGGGTNRKKLSHLRYKIEQHGELGPVLVPQGRSFRTAADAGEAILGSGDKGRPVGRAASFRAQLDTLEASIPALQRRAAAGEDVAAALTWQKARADELRRLLRVRAA